MKNNIFLFIRHLDIWREVLANKKWIEWLQLFLDFFPSSGNNEITEVSTSHPDEVESLREHDDAASLLLPDHPPEFRDSVLRGSLSDDVRVRLQYTLEH